MIKGMIYRHKLFRCTHAHLINTVVCVSIPGSSLFQLVYVSSSPVIQWKGPVLFSLYRPSQNWSTDRPNTRLLTKACSNLETRTRGPHKLHYNLVISGKSTQTEYKSSPCCKACVQYLLLIMASVALLLAHIPFASLKGRDSSPTLKQEGLCHLQPWGDSPEEKSLQGYHALYYSCL